MAEVQTNTESGEMTQRFIEFVMMQAQNAAFALGQIPHPQTGKGQVNLEMAKLFIDHLVMIRSKTRGNLSNEELGVLNNAISNLQMVFYEVAQGGEAAEEPEEEPAAATQTPDEAAQPPQASAQAAQPQQPGGAEPNEGESKKKFT